MLAVIIFLLVIDTVISFVALYRTFKNKLKILNNEVQISFNKERIEKLTEDVLKKASKWKQ